MDARRDNLHYALHCAKSGLYVFPCGADKKPLVKWRASSTVDPEQIKQQWAEHPDAIPAIDLAKSGHVVVDGDRHGGPDGVAAVKLLFTEHNASLADVPGVITPGNGEHHWFTQPNGKPLGNSDKAIRDLGINIRGAGGYVIAPGAQLPDGRRYTRDKDTPNLFVALRENALPPLPEWFVALLRPAKARHDQDRDDAPRPAQKLNGSIRHHRYAEAALDRLCQELASTAEGSRNIELNNAALRMGHMMASGWIERAIVERRLAGAAIAAGLTVTEIRDTLASGINAGMQEPHPELVDRPRQNEPTKKTEGSSKEGAPPAIAVKRIGKTGSVRDDGELPEFVIKDSDLPAAAKELAALIAQRDDFLFNGNMVVRIAVEADCMPRALEVTAEAIRVYAHEICRPVKIRKVEDKLERVPVSLTKDVALIYLNGLEGKWNLPRFRGITTAPILANDGSIRIATGFDAATGLWCQNIPDIGIAEEPSEDDARSALYRLRFFFRTFPYADSVRMLDAALGVEVTDLSAAIGLDESTFIVALLTAVCRPSLDLAPSYLVRAPGYSGSGSGKGLAVKALCIIASGSKPAAFTSGHDGEEFDKRLTAALIEAHPAVFLDNFNAKELRSDVLASALTEDPATVRPMGQTKMVPLHTRTFITITGNAVEIAEDMARRTITTNFDAKVEDPELRKFAPGFLDQVFASRAELLTDALTIWRWGRQNRLTPGKPLGNYERWAQWCRDPLVTFGMRDPIDRLAEIKAADPRRRALIAVFDAWWAAHGDTMVKATELAPEVIEQIDIKAVRKADNTLQFSRQRVARFLDAHKSTRVGGYALIQTKSGKLSKPIAYYQLTGGQAHE
jgi:hypothetical protein